MDNNLSKAEAAQAADSQFGAAFVDALTHVHTTFTTFGGLLRAEGGYVPSLVCKGRSASERDRKLLADLYDYAQALRRDPRRAFRS